MTRVATHRPVDLLVQRILNDPSEHCSDPGVAFRLTILRRWVTRAAGDDVEFVSTRGGEHVGWMLTRRGRQVADEERTRTGLA